MPSLRYLQALLSACLFLVIIVLAGLALGSAASEQMAQKRRITLQLHQDLEQCGQLHGAEEAVCQRQAQRHAEAARAELQTHRHALRQAHKGRIAAQGETGSAGGDALARRLYARHVSAWPAPEKS